MDVPQLSPETAKQCIDDGAFLLDVRETNEWDAARIPGATLAPLSAFMNHVGDIPKDRQIVVQCAAGSRSNQAAAWLRSQGFDAQNLAGGIQAWYAAGLPIDQ